MYNNYRVLCELVEEDGCVGIYFIISCKKSAMLCQFTNVISVTAYNTCVTGSLMCLINHLKICLVLNPIFF